jgi:hypothetical protein
MRRLLSMLLLGTSFVIGSAMPAMARPLGADGRVVSTPYGGTAVVAQGPPVRTWRGTTTVRRTTVVRPAPRPYARAPYAYGGRRYYAYNPYAYHVYRPYYPGPAYHPVGFLAAGLGPTAVYVRFADTGYRYDRGVWYVPSGQGYQAVAAPVGAMVSSLPQDAVAIGADQYFFGGAYYQRMSTGYLVVAPQAGMVVPDLPPGGVQVTVGDRTYIQFDNVTYQPILVNGQPQYEVVEVR